MVLILNWIIYLTLCYGLTASTEIKPGLKTAGKDGLTDLVDAYPENKALLTNIPQPYRVLYPVRIVGNQKFPISTRSHIGRHIIHIDKLEFEIDLFGQKHKLVLRLNTELLSSHVKRKHFLFDNTQVISDNIEHCYYHGRVARISDSSVALSTCDGLRGVINLSNVTYIIAPLRGGDMGLNHPHVLYRSVMAHTQTCGTMEDRWYKFTELESHNGEYLQKLKFNNIGRNKRSLSETRTIKLALISDHFVFKKMNSTRLVDYIMFMINTANIVDLYFKELNVRLSLVYLEIWNNKHQVSPPDSMRESLRKYLLYKPSAMFNTPHHDVQFITAQDFTGDIKTTSIPESICSDRAVGVNRVMTFYQPLELAHAVTHSISHNLGIKHDHSGCVCMDKSGCLMEEHIQGPGDHLRHFSTCSRDTLQDAFSLGMGDCLLPGNHDDVYPVLCGNGRLERGEQCDCRSPQHCLLSDPCCDPDTCLLATGADCNRGHCCRNCTVVSERLRCRDATSECDVPEVCDGVSGQCPADSHVVDGTGCSNGEGYCYKGVCPTHTGQCRLLWGPDATRAQDMCYTRFNHLGTFSGHCGANSTTHQYVKCYKENVMCGLLHCVGGTVNPRLPVHEVTHTLSIVSVKGNQFQCKVINSPSIPDFPQDGVVVDGTKCGDDRLCVNHECLSIGTVTPGSCPTAVQGQVCSGRGVCTSRLTCFCDEKWAGYDCNTVRPTASVVTTLHMPTSTLPSETTDSMTFNNSSNRTGAPVDGGILVTDAGVFGENGSDVTLWLGKNEVDNVSTDTLLIILAGVAGSLVVIFGLSLLCYRRRSPSGGPYAASWLLGSKKKKKMEKDRPVSMSSEEAPNPANRIIKFATDMPSYREEKEIERQQRRKMILQGMMQYSNGEEGATVRLVSPEEVPYPSTAISLDKVPEKGILKNGSQSPNRLRRGVQAIRDAETASQASQDGSTKSSHDGSLPESNNGSLPEDNGSHERLLSEGAVAEDEDDDLKKSDSDSESLCSDYGSIDGGTLLRGSPEKEMPPCRAEDSSGSPSSGRREPRSNIRNIDDLIRQIEEQVNKTPECAATCDDTGVQTESPESETCCQDYSSGGSSGSERNSQQSPDYPNIAPLATDETYSPDTDGAAVVSQFSPSDNELEYDDDKYSPDDNTVECEHCPNGLYPCAHERCDNSPFTTKQLRDSPELLKRNNRSPGSPASSCSDNNSQRWHFSPTGSPRLNQRQPSFLVHSPDTSPHLHRQRYDAPYRHETGLNQNTEIDPLARSPSTPPESHASSPEDDHLINDQPNTLRKYIDCVKQDSPATPFKANITLSPPWKRSFKGDMPSVNFKDGAKGKSSPDFTRKFLPSVLRSNFFHRAKSDSPEAKRKAHDDPVKTNVSVRASSTSPQTEYTPLLVHTSVPTMLSEVKPASAPPPGRTLHPPSSKPFSKGPNRSTSNDSSCAGAPRPVPLPTPSTSKPTLDNYNSNNSSNSGKPSNLPLETINRRSHRSPSELYKRFSPIFPAHMLKEDSFRVNMADEPNRGDRSPDMNPYSPDESPNDGQHPRLPSSGHRSK